MKLLIVIIIVSIFLNCNTKEINTSKSLDLNQFNPDTNKIAIFSSKKANTKGTNFQLSENDFKMIDTLIENSIREYNTKYGTEINLEQYYRQYEPIINEFKEKEIWIYCFCYASNIDWKKEMLFVSDGGECYFRLEINLTKKKVINFSVNGSA
ncbi:MAG: hypothetical protein RO257_07550 [Candidatus Kapabacteria bacterium]|nr:hypothetical protein [Candidatus Kapabacteria bacterium]